VYRVALAIAAPFMALVGSVLFSANAAALEAYIFRGAGDFTFIAKGLSFSEGMDRLGQELEQAGIHSEVYRWEAGEWAYRDIMKRRPDAVILAGHSMGALTSLALASRLKGSGIRVAYMGLIDIPGPAGIAPSNVEIADNFFHAFPVYGRLTGGPGHKGIVRNNLIWGQIHVTMDNSKKVHNAILASVADIRGEPDVMQAYSGESRPEQTTEGQGLVASVGDFLTGSVTNSGASTSDASIPVARAAGGSVGAVAVDGQAYNLAYVSLPEIGPVPTPRPGGLGMKQFR
jgi:Thioesterase domain